MIVLTLRKITGMQFPLKRKFKEQNSQVSKYLLKCVGYSDGHRNNTTSVQIHLNNFCWTWGAFIFEIEKTSKLMWHLKRKKIKIFHICLVGNSYVGLHFYVFWMNCPKSLKIHKERVQQYNKIKKMWR